MEVIERKKEFRLGIRIPLDLNDRLDALVLALKRGKMPGQRPSKDSVVADALQHYIDFVERGGDETAPAGFDKASIYAKLKQVEGILTDVYKELGGAELAIKEEREGYSRRTRPVGTRKSLPHNS